MANKTTNKETTNVEETIVEKEIVSEPTPVIEEVKPLSKKERIRQDLKRIKSS